MKNSGQYKYSGSGRFILVSNREPFEHQREDDGSITLTNPAGGLTSALQPLMESSGGTWVAWGSGSADFDVTDEQGEIRVPPDNPAYSLRRVRLSPQEVRSYYVESANRALWPLCHLQFNHFTFDREHWEVYRKVNERFARAVGKAVGQEPATVWVQDYHFGLAPRMLRKRDGLFVHQFWHIPWPPADVLRALPAARSLLRGLLGNDLLVFQTDRYVVNFLSSVAEFLSDAEVDLDRGSVTFQGHTTRVSAHAISIDVDSYEEISRSEAVEKAAQRIKRTLAPRGRILLGVDRIDYSKGIPRRFNAFTRLLETRPDLRGKVTLVQVAVPSREAIGSYRALERSVVSMANKCNARYGTERWKPVVLIRDNLDTAALAAHYRAADVCLVSSLQDGMNLVAKEFVACQAEGTGALILSRFAGAAEELTGAVIINPYDAGGMARAIESTLEMSPRERRVRLAAMRRQVKSNTIFDWMRAIFSEVEEVRHK